jgi:hypothetical protein
MNITFLKEQSKSEIKYRKDSDIDYILSNVGSTCILENFLSQNEIDHLLSIHKNYENKREKITGPITSKVPLRDPVFIDIFKRIESIIGKELNIFGGNYFQVDWPHIIHNDVPFDHSIIPGKCIVIPLEKIYKDPQQIPKKTDSKFYVFDQMYFHGPVKAFRNSRVIKNVVHNIPLYEYTDVYGLDPSDEYPDIDTTHCDPEWTRGLTVEKECLWVPGSIIIFDCVRLHCADDFRFTGIRQKTGLSVFTTYA